jgi:universal stress protein A
MFKRILVAVDESKVALEAVDVAAQLAAQLGAQIAAVHVVDDTRAFVRDLSVLDKVVMAELRRDGVAALVAACDRIPRELKVERVLVEGEPSEMIISTARDKQVDLIVLGNDSRGRLAHFLLGSTADSVIRRAPCPVVTVRMGGKLEHEHRPASAAAGA